MLALRPDGTPVPGWPVSTDALSAPHNQPVNGTTPSGQIVGSVAVGDIDGDKQPEVVAASFKGGVYAWHRDGTRVAGFPVQVPPVSQYTDPPQPSHPVNPEPAVRRPVHQQPPGHLRPALQRLRVDRRAGAREPREAHRRQARHRRRRPPTSASTSSGPNGSVLGDVYPNDPTTNADSRPAKIADTPAVGDINADGNLDIVVGTEEIQGSTGNTSGRIYAFDGFTLRDDAARPRRCAGWPVALPSLAASGVPAVATGVISSPALFPSTAGNGTLQTATGVFLAGSDAAHPAFTINSNGSQGTILQTNAPGAGSNFTDSPFLWAVAQTAVGQLGLDVERGRDRRPQHPDRDRHRRAARQEARVPARRRRVRPRDGAAVPTFPRQIEDWQFLSGPAIADVKGDGTPPGDRGQRRRVPARVRPGLGAGRSARTTSRRR